MTSGGRVLGVTATGKDLNAALSTAYKATEQIKFKDAFYRKDIGARALAALKNKQEVTKWYTEFTLKRKTICRRGCIAFIGYTLTAYDRLA